MISTCPSPSRGATRPTASVLAPCILLAAVAACGDDANTLGPDNQPQVSNLVNTFEWQVSGLDNVSQTLTYIWTDTGTSADVNQASALTDGSATLAIMDATGVEVYSGSLGENGTFQTSAGTTGDWTIRVTLTHASGNLNFRVEKP